MSDLEAAHDLLAAAEPIKREVAVEQLDKLQREVTKLLQIRSERDR